MFILLCLLLGLQQIVADCPPYWTQFQNNCYRYYGKKVSWKEAEEVCNNHSPAKHYEWATVGHLTSINTQAEQDFVYTLWASSRESAEAQPNCWIGFMVNEENADFTWSDESPTSYTNWDTQRPNNQGVEKCAEMWEATYGHKPKSWNDTPCDQKNHAPFICKLIVV